MTTYIYVHIYIYTPTALVLKREVKLEAQVILFLIAICEISGTYVTIEAKAFDGNLYSMQLFMTM